MEWKFKLLAGVLLGAVLIGILVYQFYFASTSIESKEEMKKIVQNVIFERWLEVKEYGFTIEELNFSLIKNHKIFRVFPKFTLQPGVALDVIAVGYDGEVFILPENFGNIIKRENLSINKKLL